MLIQAIENQIFRKAAPIAVRYLAKPDLDTKHPLARKVLDQALREFQLAPPVTVHLSDPELMAAVWCVTREAYVVGAKGRAVREAVAAAISRLNECPYCITVHAGMFESAGRDARQLDDPSRLPAEIKPAYAFAAATLSPGSNELAQPRIAPADRPQIFATAVAYHYINRMVSIFLGETPVALPGMTTAPGKKLVHSSFAFFGKRIVSLDPKPGECVVQKQAQLPDEFSWAKTSPHVAGSLALLALAAEQAGEEAVPEAVRTLVIDHLADWRGEPATISRGWVEELVTGLDERDKPSARLAVLAARAAWQVDSSLIEEFQKVTRDDRPLLQTVAWASFAAARRIAEWFPHQSQKEPEGVVS